MSKLTKTEELLYTLIILCVLVWSAAGFFSYQVFSQTNDTGALIDGAKKDLKRDADLRATKNSLSANEDKIMELDSFFVASDKAVDFIETIEAIGRQTGVTLTIGSVSTEANLRNPNDFKEIIKMRLQAGGSWQGVYHFLTVLENLPYGLSVDTASITLNISSQNLFFSTSPTTRRRTEKEAWIGHFDVSVLKIK